MQLFKFGFVTVERETQFFVTPLTGTEYGAAEPCAYGAFNMSI
jgi:hypothetical protein